MSTRLTQRQYQTHERELARQLQERDRESFSELRALYSSISNLSVKVSSLWVFPEDLGAKRDGKTDDSRAIQDAVTYAESRGGAVWLRLGVYRISSTIVIRDTVRIFGDSGAVLLQTGTNLTHIRIVSGVTDATIEGFEIRGNQTGLGGVNTGGLGGHGIAASGAINMTINRMRFSLIGVPSSVSVHGNYASPISGVGCDGATISNNYFAPTCHNRTGADMLVSGDGCKFLFNRSESDCDSVIGSGGGGVGACIVGNWGKRLPGTMARSGILVEYGEHTTDARVVGNHMEGFPWHGFYASHTFDYPGEETFGGITFSDNIAIYCGGGRPGDTSFITGSFHLHGRRGLNGSGNRSLFDGYDSTMTPRGVLESAGILFLDDVANVALTDTIIRQPYQYGVFFRALNTDSMLENVQFSNLHVIDCATSHGFHVNAQATNAECIRNIKVHTARITVLSSTASGVRCAIDNGSWFNNVTLDNVDVKYNGVSASSAAGITWSGYSDYTRNTGRISECGVNGFANGISCSYTVTLFVPFALRVVNNRLENVTLGMALGGGTLYWAVHEGTTGLNVTTMNPSRSRSGRMLGPAGSGRTNVEMTQVNLINAVPPDGAWTVGDRVFMAAKAGPIVGYECTVAGSVGTWKPIYSYGFGGEILRLGATPIVNSTAPTFDGMSAWTATGAATAAAFANTNRYTRMTRMEVLQAGASTTNVAAYQNADLGWLLNTGFYVRFQWGLATGVATTTLRAFAGLVASTAAPTDVEPSSLASMVGMGWDAADTNVQIMRNDASGTATKIDLGSTFPVPTTDATQVYTLEMISMGSGTGIQYAVTNETTGVLIRGSFATDVPVGTTPLAPQIWASVGGTSSVVGIAFAGFYGERAY